MWLSSMIDTTSKTGQAIINFLAVLSSLSTASCFLYVYLSTVLLLSKPNIPDEHMHIYLICSVAIVSVGSMYHTLTLFRYSNFICRSAVATKEWAGLKLYYLATLLYPQLNGAYELAKKNKRTQLAVVRANQLTIATNPGYIYIMRRSDGIYKLGRSVDTDSRIKQHESDYGLSFELVTRFVVPDAIEFEKLALSMTNDFRHYEHGRQELRRMTGVALNIFIDDFELICKEAVRL